MKEISKFTKEQMEDMFKVSFSTKLFETFQCLYFEVSRLQEALTSKAESVLTPPAGIHSSKYWKKEVGMGHVLSSLTRTFQEFFDKKGDWYFEKAQREAIRFERERIKKIIQRYGTFSSSIMDEINAINDEKLKEWMKDE